MPLREELRAQGDVLFRHRSYAPFAFVALYALALRHSNWLEANLGDAFDDAWDWTCVALSLLGLSLRTYVAGTVPRRTSGRNTSKGQVADQLNDTGAYSVVRHPLYVGNFLVFLGLCLAPAVWWMALLGTCVFWLYYERIAFAEEEFLRESFGRRWMAWASARPAFVPDPRLFRPARLRFSWRTALKREYLTVMNVALLFAALDYAEDVAADGLAGLTWEAETSIAAALILGACLVLRVLRKHTRVLHVPGR